MPQQLDASTLSELCSVYGFSGSVKSTELLTNGHINETYRVIIDDDNGEHNYIFQKVNANVFTEPMKIMHNLSVVDEYLRGHTCCGGCSVLTYIPTANGENYSLLPDGGFWRISEFVRHSVTYEMIENAEMMRKTGYAFGDFQRKLAGVSIAELDYTIPDFHNTPKRINAFFEKVNADPLGRAAGIADDIRFFEDNRDRFCTLQQKADDGTIPLRVTHNDTKCNNILFDRDSGDPVAVIDLDTVMPGLAAHDFGDAIRCAANYAEEDERDLSKVGLNMEYYDAFTRGFVCASKEVMTPSEAEYLALGAPTIAFELASRFLADYIDGDKYFRIHHEGHNLERARCQMALCRDMMDKYDEMCACVKKYYC